jgi:hypothetical protein
MVLGKGKMSHIKRYRDILKQLRSNASSFHFRISHHVLQSTCQANRREHIYACHSISDVYDQLLIFKIWSIWFQIER